MKIKRLIYCLLFISSIQFDFAQCGCDSSAGVFPIIINNVTVDTISSGDISNFGSIYNWCDVNAGPIWLGANSSFTLTFIFSSPVNNVQLSLNASDYPETFSFTVNSGTLSLQVCTPPITYTCDFLGGVSDGPYVQSENNLSVPASSSNEGLSQGILTITSSNNYTSLSVSGNGGKNGSLMGLCLSQTFSIIPILTANSTTICAGDSSSLLVSGANTYTWIPATSLSNENISNPIASPSVTTTYTINGTDAQGGVGTTTCQVIVNPLPLLSINSPTVCEGENATLIASGANTYTWSTGDTTATIITKPALTTTYTVTGAIGTCSNQATAIVQVNTSFDFVLPNIVTPNKDGVNDEIDFSKYQFSTLQLDIYNRWGKKVFESSDPACVWKPTEDDGVYFLVANYRIYCDDVAQTKTIKSFITLIK